MEKLLKEIITELKENRKLKIKQHDELKNILLAQYQTEKQILNKLQEKPWQHSEQSTSE